MTLTVKPPCDEAAILSASVGEPCSSNSAWILVATILGSSLAFIDGTVVNIALPALQSALHATISDVQWVVESYALLLASLLLVGGSLGDIYGRRKIFVAGLILFALGFRMVWTRRIDPSADCCAWGSRYRCGVAGAREAWRLSALPFQRNRRGHAIGTWSGFTAITAAVGPVLGGWLVDHASWRWVFFINLPIAVVVVLSDALASAGESESRSKRKTRLAGRPAGYGGTGWSYVRID